MAQTMAPSLVVVVGRRGEGESARGRERRRVRRERAGGGDRDRATGEEKGGEIGHISLQGTDTLLNYCSLSLSLYHPHFSLSHTVLHTHTQARVHARTHTTSLISPF